MYYGSVSRCMLYIDFYLGFEVLLLHSIFGFYCSVATTAYVRVAAMLVLYMGRHNNAGIASSDMKFISISREFLQFIQSYWGRKY
jgi:hypothetical protein